MDKHTPGKWKIEPLLPGRKYYGTRILLGRDDMVIEVWTPGECYEASEREIANGWTPDCGFDHVETAECYANARLIAAAPDLLEALKRVVTRAHQYVGIGFDMADESKELREAISDAANIIAKAEGK